MSPTPNTVAAAMTRNPDPLYFMRPSVMPAVIGDLTRSAKPRQVVSADAGDLAGNVRRAAAAAFGVFSNGPTRTVADSLAVPIARGVERAGAGIAEATKSAAGGIRRGATIGAAAVVILAGLAVLALVRNLVR